MGNERLPKSDWVKYSKYLWLYSLRDTLYPTPPPGGTLYPTLLYHPLPPPRPILYFRFTFLKRIPFPFCLCASQPVFCTPFSLPPTPWTLFCKSCVRNSEWPIPNIVLWTFWNAASAWKNPSTGFGGDVGFELFYRADLYTEDVTLDIFFYVEWEMPRLSIR